MTSGLRARCLALLIGLFCTIPAAFGDDIDIYTSQPANPSQPPMTILVLDLNLLGICQNILLNGVVTPNGTQGSNSTTNPEAPQLCLNLSNNMLLGDVLAGITSNPNLFLSNLLLGTGTNNGLRATALCDLYGILGISSPLVSIPGVGFLLAPLLNGVSTLSCGTLGFLLTLLDVPILGDIINGLLSGFVGQLVAGLLSPLLTTTVGQLPSTVVGLLSTSLGGVLNLGQIGLISLLESILNQLINSKVAIVVSHGDRANVTGSPASACAFGDAASIPLTRRETLNCSNGAYFLVGFTSLVDQGSVTQLLTRVVTLLTNTLQPTNLLNSITALLGTALTTPQQLLPPYQGKEIYTEITHYLAGDEVFNAPLSRWDGLTGLLTRDTSIENNGRYRKPEAVCRTVNVLNVQLTNSQREGESDGRLRSYYPGAVQNNAITFPNLVKEAQDVGFLDAAGNRISLRSHFLVQENLSSLSALSGIGVNVLTYANNLGLLNLGQSIAPFLKPNLAVNASLVTPSQTIDLTQPARRREEAFFAGFKPTIDKSPRWPGNVKRLKLLTASNGTFSYVDRSGNNAIASDGRIAASALTFWTNSGLLGSAVADGREVTLGGAGQKIPGFALLGGGAPGRRNADTGARKLLYDRYVASTMALAPLDADTASTTAVTELATVLGATAETAATCITDKTAQQVAQEILLHARGYDTGGSCKASKGAGTGVVGRAWLHGAVLHSRPVAINYGGSSPDIRIVYGSSDGFLRMVKNSDGSEAWGFMPQAVMSQQKILRNNTASTTFPYGVDGAPVVLQQQKNAQGIYEKVYVYFGLRRSGRQLYALNVSSPDAPAALWTITPSGLYRSSGIVPGTGAHFAELGLTFSTPQVGRMRVKNGTTEETRSVLLFGGGYSTGKDTARGSAGLVGTDDSIGNAIFIVDALTGELLWKAKKGSFSTSSPYDSSSRAFQHPQLDDSIPSDVTAVDSDGDGFTDRLYVADTGGRLWRGDFAGSDRSKWTLTPLASVGRHATSDVANDRRFFHAPDYVPFRDGAKAYDAIVFASGDREDPTNTAGENYLYAFRDADVTSGKLVSEVLGTGQAGQPAVKTHANFSDLTTACAANTENCAGASNTDLTTTGWKIKLSRSGEKALTQPVTTSGVVYFNSYVPEAATCEPSEGGSRFYGVALKDSRPVVTTFGTDSDGDARSTLAKTPGLANELSALPGNSIAGGAEILSTDSRRYYETYWRERRNDEETPP